MNDGWIPIDQQPAPGDYLTRRDLAVKEDKHRLKQIRAWIGPAHFNGESWNLPAQPDYYREIPGKKQ